MLHHSFIYPALLFSIMLVAIGSVMPSAMAGDTVSATPAAAVAAPVGGPVSAGTIEDSLSACLARIPKDATQGQRMIAEQSCQRAEVERQPAYTFSGR